MKVTTKQSASAVLLLTLLMFSRVLFCDFVNLDDPQYVYLNPAIKIFDWRFIVESFTTSYMGWWMPLTWLSFALDHFFWGLNPFGYHLTNLLLHAANAGLVVFVAEKVLKHIKEGSLREEDGALSSTLNPQPSPVSYLIPLLAGIIWGIHPLRVESVAWVTERKDVLSGFFSFLSLYYYLRRGSPGKKSLSAMLLKKHYLLALGFFMLALLAKPVSVVLPAMFLVLDWSPLDRFRQGKLTVALVEKLPFFLLSTAIAAATLYFAAGETILVSLSDYPLYKRLLVAGYALIEYCRMSLYPLGLTHLYVLPITFTPLHYVFTALSLLFTGSCIFLRNTHSWLLATWLLFVLPLLPVLGFFQNGSQSHADRFTYLPALFPSIAAAAILTVVYEYLRKQSPRNCRLFLILVAGLLLFYGAITVKMIGVWKNSATLWSRLLAIQPVGRAYYYRGEYFLTSGQYQAAVSDLQSAVRFAEDAGLPKIYNLYALLGDALSKSGRFDEAVRAFTTAIEMNPLPNYYYHRGLALTRLGRIAEAESDLKTAGAATGPIIIDWSNR